MGFHMWPFQCSTSVAEPPAFAKAPTAQASVPDLALTPDSHAAVTGRRADPCAAGPAAASTLRPAIRILVPIGHHIPSCREPGRRAVTAQLLPAI